MVLEHTQALDLTWIRSRISQYVTLKDALACALVCKEWSEDFIPSVWHTVDFDIHKRFNSVLTKDAVSKHGHHIRVIRNLKVDAQVYSLQNSSVRNLRNLSIVMGVTSRIHAYCYDILRRNNGSLICIDIKMCNNTSLYFFADALFTSTEARFVSKLTIIKIDGLAMTRDSFSLLLRMSPLLEEIVIQGTTLVSTPSTDIYRHPNVTKLTCTVRQAFIVDSADRTSQPLFAHFPNILIWTTWNTSTGINAVLDFPIQSIKSEMARHCPSLRSLNADFAARLLIQVLTKCIEGLKGVVVPHYQLSTELIMAILTHGKTLESISTFIPTGFFESATVPKVETHLQERGWVIQMLPKVCTRLISLKLVYYPMDLDDIESSPWCCPDLEVLYIRIVGLETMETINRTIQLWAERKRKERNIPSPDATEKDIQADLSLEDRVVRHLLKFEKLKEVWLGTDVRRVR